MKGLPTTHVRCSKCGSDEGYPKTKLCRACWPHPQRRCSWTPQLDERLRCIYRFSTDKRELSTALAAFAEQTRFPKHIILNRAQRLGVSRHCRKDWRPEEIERLREEAGQMGTRRLAKELGRSYPAVLLKLRQLKISAVQQGSYSESDLALKFGATWTRIHNWTESGRLLRNTDGRIERGEVLRFIVEAPDAFDPRLVDLVWFRDMLRRIGVMLADLKRTEGLDVKFPPRRAA